MFSKIQNLTLAGVMRESLLWFAAGILILSASIPLILQGSADAASMTSRSVTIDNSNSSATGVSYDFDFTFPSTTAAQSIALSFCTTPLGTCTLPTSMNVDFNNTSISAQTFSEATSFTEYSGADAGACTDHNSGASSTQYCATRSDTDSETATAKSITIAGVANPSIPSGNNTTVYVRVAVYSDTAFATLAHDGTVAASIVNQLTVTGRVQERLVFCAFALDDTAGSSGTVGTAAGNYPTSCSATEATASSNVDIGVVDNSTIARSPVDNSPPTSLGNDRFGALMTNTNASNGVALTYYATQAGTGTNELRAFRVSGATCNASGTDTTDQCFISADDSAGETFTAGTERFGMQMACVTNSNTTTAGTTANLGTGGNGSGSSGTFNTVYANSDTALAGDFEDNGTDTCEAESGDLYGWRDSGTAQALISSTSVVDDEVVKLRFGATANATTPTGTYTAASTFIATATF